jgi:hypothetical protein
MPGDTVDENYTETRYYKLEDSEGYDKLVKLNTEYGVPTSGQGSSSNVSYINSNLYNYFNINNFINGIGNTLVVEADSSSLSEFIRKAKENNSNSNLRDYYDNLNNTISASNEYILDKHVKNLAEKVTDYFVVSTALYDLLYATDNEIDSTEPIEVTKTTNLKIEYHGFIEADFAITNDDSSSSKQNAIINYLYGFYTKAVEALKLNDETDQKYSNHLSQNIDLNKAFLEQQQKLDSNQDVFDTKKALVITMMAKAHKANKLYSKKKLWFTIYLSMLIVYLLAVVGVIYAASSSYEMFNMFQNAMVGLVITVLSSFILISLFIYEISKYFYK